MSKFEQLKNALRDPAMRYAHQGPEAAEAIENLEMQIEIIKQTAEGSLKTAEVAIEKIKQGESRIAELEAALKKIADDGNYNADGCWYTDSYPYEIARTALGENND